MLSRFRSRLVSELVRQRREEPIKSWIIALASVPFGGVCVWVALASDDGEWWVVLFGVLLVVFGLGMLRVLTEPLPPTIHEVTVSQDPPFSWASCSCGWDGDEGESLQQVVDDANRHAVGARVVVLDPLKPDPATLGFALVSQTVVNSRETVRVMFRELPREPEDSGWRIYSGTESTSEMSTADHLVQCPITTVLELDDSIERVIDEDAPCAFEREREGQQFRRSKLRFKGTPAV